MKVVQTNSPHWSSKPFIGKSLLAGVAISLGCIANLSVENPYIGALLFTFGLASTVVLGFDLLTGKMGNKVPFLYLIAVGFFNFCGCAIMSSFYVDSSMYNFEALQQVLDYRNNINWLALLLGAVGCGFIVSSSIQAAKRENWIVMVLGIPLFILTGMLHCVADMFYYSCAMVAGLFTGKMFLVWIFTVLFNYIGCNLVRLLKHI